MSKLISTTPMQDGYSMPAEYDLHSATLMIWPKRPGSWGRDPHKSRKAFCDIFSEILKSEDLYILTSSKEMEETLESIRMQLDISDYDHKLSLVPIDTDDSWARDVGPTFIRNGFGDIRGINWKFNAWGGNYDGLYASWDKDDAVAISFCRHLGVDIYNASPFVLEGGSIHSDGEGTILVTKSCLLSKGRNPGLSQQEIEDKLKCYLGAEKVLWLPYGIYNDETNEHVDNVCAFTSPGEVILAFTDNKNDPQYEMSLKDLEYLENVTDARGRHLRIHKLPIPDYPVCISDEDMDNFVFEEGEDNRREGERLAASYVNFYFTNSEVLVPAFGNENSESDKRAVRILSEVCKNRKVVPIDARAILLGGGNIHCITQQIPSGISNMRRKIIKFE